MKKILMISYDWPPQGSVGMIRLVRFAKYLKRAGHEVSVVTSETASCGSVIWDIEDHEIEDISVRRIPSCLRRTIVDCLTDKLNPQFESRFFRSVIDKADEIIGETDFDVVISSSPPESAHAAAAEIKKRKSILWISDLRDLWADDHYRSFSLPRRAFIRAQESAALKNSDIILTVSEAWGMALKKRYGGRVEVIPNGYDKDYFDRIGFVRSDKFVISYLGKLNSRHQDITQFFTALKNLLSTNAVSRDLVKVDFYVSGYGKPDIGSIAREFGLSDIVTEYTPIPFGKALGIMKNSSLLLLVGWMGLSASGWRPQKLYEYIGSGTPVLLVNGSENTELAGLIASGVNCRSAVSVFDIGDQLKFYYDAFKFGTPVRSDSGAGAAALYTAANMAEKLSRLIESKDPS